MTIKRIVLIAALFCISARAADVDKDSVSCADLHYHMRIQEEAFAADIVRYQQELASASKDLSHCQATSMASTTRESMLKTQMAQLEQSSGSPEELVELQRTVRELQLELQTSKQTASTQATAMLHERDALKEEVQVLRSELEAALTQAGSEFKQRDAFRLEMDAASGKHALEMSEWKTQIAELKTKLESAESENAAINAQAEAQQALAIQLSSEKVAMESTVATLKNQLQAAKTEKLSQEAAVDARVQLELEKAVKEAATRTAGQIQFLVQQKKDLAERNRQLAGDSAECKSKLQAVQTELFAVRRELFAANEKLREPELRRQMRIKQFREIVDTVDAHVHRVRELAQPHYDKYLQPVMVKMQRYWDAAVEFVVALSKAAGKFALAQVKTMQEHAPELMEQATKLFETASELVKLQLTRCQQAAKPYTKQFVEATEEPRMALKASYQDFLEPHVQNMLKRHEDAKHATAKTLLVAMDVLLDYCTTRHLSHSNPVVRLTNAVHSHTAETIQYAEYSFVALIAYLLLFRRRGRNAKGSVKKLKTE